MRCRFVVLTLVLQWLAASRLLAAPTPELIVHSPSNAQTIQGTSVTVDFEARGFSIVPSSVPLNEAGKHPEVNRPGEGHVHLMLDLQPLVVWYQTDAYTFADVPPGDHQLMVELVNNDHSSLSPQVAQLIRFRTVAASGTMPPGAGPALAVRSPQSSQSVQGDAVSIAFDVSSFNIVTSTVPLNEAGKHPEVNRPGEGHLHLMLDLQPLVVWYQATPYTFTNVPRGDHQLMVEVVNNDHSSLSPAVARVIRFRSEAAAAGQPAQASPALTVQFPANNQSINGTDFAVAFRADNFQIVPSSIPLNEAGKHPEVNRPGQGHVHLMLDLQPLVVWYQATPYTFQNIPPGDHQLMVELVNNDHSSLSPQIAQVIHFHVGQVMPTTGGETTTGIDLTRLGLVLGALLTAAASSFLFWRATSRRGVL